MYLKSQMAQFFIWCYIFYKAPKIVRKEIKYTMLKTTEIVLKTGVQSNLMVTTIYEIVDYLQRKNWVIQESSFSNVRINISDFVKESWSFVTVVRANMEKMRIVFWNCKVDRRYFESFVWISVRKGHLGQVVY